MTRNINPLKTESPINSPLANTVTWKTETRAIANTINAFSES